MAEVVASLRKEPTRTKAPAIALWALAVGLAASMLVIGLAGSATAMPMPRPAFEATAISTEPPEGAPDPTPVTLSPVLPIAAVAAVSTSARGRTSDVREVLDPFGPRAPGRAFDRAAAVRAVSATSVAQCSAAWGTPRHVLVRVVFRPRGDVARVSAVATRGDCVQKQFKSLHVTPYVGGEEVVERVVTVVEQ